MSCRKKCKHISKNTIVYFKYHDKNIDLGLYEKINGIKDIAIKNNNNFIETSNPDYYLLNSDIVINANIFSDTPKLLSASFGVTPGAVYIFDETEILSVYGNYNTNLSIDRNLERSISTTPDIRNINSYTNTNYMVGFDQIPICFSNPCLLSSIDVNCFVVYLNTGLISKPISIASGPNSKYNEKHCVLLCGYFGNRLKGPNAVYPTSLEIIKANGSTFKLIGKKGLIDATGMSINILNAFTGKVPGTILSCILNIYYTPKIYNYLGDEGCGLTPFQNNSGYLLYGKDAQYKFRIYTSCGYSPNGISSMTPDNYERYFYLQYTDPKTMQKTDLIKSNYIYQFSIGSVEIVGLADLGQKQDTYDEEIYMEDHDNYIDICVKGNYNVIKNIKKLIVPSDGQQYTKFYNPSGPGPTPQSDVTYTIPSVYQEVDIVNNIKNPNCVTYISYDVKKI